MYDYIVREHKQVIAPVRIAAWSALVLSVLPGIEALFRGGTLRFLAPFPVFFGAYPSTLAEFPSEPPANPAIFGLVFLLVGLFIFGLLIAASPLLKVFVDIRLYGTVMNKGPQLPQGRRAPVFYSALEDVPNEVPKEEQQVVSWVKTAAWSALGLSILPGLLVVISWMVKGSSVLYSYLGWAQNESAPAALVGLAFLLAGLFIFGVLTVVAAAMEAINAIQHGFTRRPQP